jgi:hypothetical protein
MIKMTQATLNEFWTRESELARQRASDPATCRLALRQFNVMVSEGNFRKASFEICLRNGQEAKDIVLEEMSRKGGKTPRRDALNDVIRSILLMTPEIAESEMLKKLEGEDGAGVVIKIDSPSECPAGEAYIHYVNDDGSEKLASLRGLKDRISKIREKLKNESL